MVQLRPRLSEGVRGLVTSRGALLVILALALGQSPSASPGLANPQAAALPAAQGVWSSSDYVQAIFAVHNGDMTLPRRDNPKTEAVFARLIDRANIEKVMKSSLSLEDKRQQLLIILSATGEFRGRYGYAVALGDELQDELIDIQIFRLYVIDRLAMVEGHDGATLKRSASAIATTVFGTLDTLGEARVFSSAQLIALSEALARHYPAIETKLTADERRKAVKRLEQMASAAGDAGLRSALASALAASRGGN